MLGVKKTLVKRALLMVSLSIAALAQGQNAAGDVGQQASQYLSLEALLEQVKQGRIRDNRMNAERLERFRQNRATRQEALEDLQQEQNQAEALSTDLEARFNANDETIADLEGKLEDRLGSIKELFGVLQQVSSDSHAQLSNSLTQLHYPERAEFLLAFANKMGQTKVLPKIGEIERLWFELQREMTASGDVVDFEHSVVNTEGIDETRTITRVGLFNLVSDGKYLQFIPETGRVIEYGRQPHSRYTDGAAALAEAEQGDTVRFAIDPTRGQLLSLLVKAPGISERIQQGGIIGYTIIGLGIVAVLLAIQRLLALQLISGKVRKQMKNPENPGNNPLGRILAAYQDNKSADQDALELKLGESILREVPRINRFIPMLKIIAAVAPLMGLLGTVTGMIITFQAITLFGAGDPKLMANGISQALMTTVLGLCVAIPTLLLHNLVQTRAKYLVEVLEQESVALVAAHMEQEKTTEAGVA